MWRQSCRRSYMAAQPHTCLQKSAISTTFFRWSDSITQGLSFYFLWYFLPSSKLTTTFYSCSHLRHLGLSYTMDSVVILCEMLSVACHIRCGQSLSCIRLNGYQLFGCNQKAGLNICAMAKHRRWININQSSSLTTPIGLHKKFTKWFTQYCWNTINCTRKFFNSARLGPEIAKPLCGSVCQY